jgi:hypothetical protein
MTSIVGKRASGHGRPTGSSNGPHKRFELRAPDSNNNRERAYPSYSFLLSVPTKSGENTSYMLYCSRVGVHSRGAHYIFDESSSHLDLAKSSPRPRHILTSPALLGGVEFVYKIGRYQLRLHHFRMSRTTSQTGPEVRSLNAWELYNEEARSRDETLLKDWKSSIKSLPLFVSNCRKYMASN